MYIHATTKLVAPVLTPLSVLEKKYRWGERNHKIFSRFHKMQSASLFEHEALPDLIIRLLQQLRAECDPGLFRQIRYVAWAHSLHAVSPFDLMTGQSGGLQALFGDRDIEFFSVTQASCASGLVSLKYLQAKMSAAQQNNAPVCGLLITGEKCFHRTVQYVDQNGYFGEAFCATLVGMLPSVQSLRLRALHIQQLAAYGTRMRSTDRESENAYDHAFLPMMTETIQKALEAAGRKPEDLSAVLPYHISPVTFDRIADRTGFGREIIFHHNLYTLGHCFCSDAFLNLHSLLARHDHPVKSQCMLALASGVAGTFGAMVLESENEGNQ
ncbi:3-oxoacyl-ACP synthase [Rahnella sp. C60]|uniref:3-oxoacyl-[acyl-carrier-protein] synthase III C-terminal domain-containing protein n=1 Tax=Rahnella perminowiae TaxID=2816244 RepID=UPI001C277BEB|nr:3-oxoacyl-ACP synthase [Rahnella perminowiae]